MGPPFATAQGSSLCDVCTTERSVQRSFLPLPWVGQEGGTKGCLGQGVGWSRGEPTTGLWGQNIDVISLWGVPDGLLLTDLLVY